MIQNSRFTVLYSVYHFQCRTLQNQLKRCCGFCLPRKTAEQPRHVCQDNPSTSEQAVYRQCSEISYRKEATNNYLLHCSIEGDIAIFGFAVLAIFLDRFLGSVVPKDFGFSVLVFTAVCGFFVF